MQEVLEVNIIQKLSQVNNAIIKQKGVKVECQGMFTAVLGWPTLGMQACPSAVGCWLYVWPHDLIFMVPRCVGQSRPRADCCRAVYKRTSDDVCSS